MRSGYFLLILSTIWIFALLSAWDLRQVLASGVSFNGLIFGDYWAISNHVSWLPLSAEIARGNIFPIDPLLGQGGSGIGFFPYLSLWITGVLIALFGTGVTLLIGSTLLPTMSYFFMVLIYRRYLPWRWSISLSALGILGFNSAPFREFLASLMAGDGWEDFGIINSPDVIGFPFPAISLLSFLVLFYLSVQRTYLSRRRLVILSIAWGLQTQIHLLNAVFGIPFWFPFLALNIWRSNRNNWTKQRTLELLTQFFITIIF